jgi:CSLREA domain-containing protein
MKLHRLVTLIATVGLLLGGLAPSMASTLNVTRFDDPPVGSCDPGDCSLREAVLAAEATAAADLVLLDVGTYTLDSLELLVTHPLTLQGQGSRSTTIRNAFPFPNPGGRILRVTYSNLRVVGITVREGNVESLVSGFGGCIYAFYSELEMEDVAVSDCKVAGIGGGVLLTGSTATFNKVRISGNRSGHGGGIALQGDSYLTVYDSVIADNYASEMGGGLMVSSSSLSTPPATIRFGSGVQVTKNLAEFGGGIAIYAGAELDIAPDPLLQDGTLLAIEGNEATSDGGGLWLASAIGSFPAANLTASGLGVRMNVAGKDGGGLHSLGLSVVRDSEFAFNHADNDGGGVALRGAVNGSLLERVSLAGNRALRYGGGYSSSNASSTLRNVSSYRNRALSGGGFDIANSVRIMHLTSFGDSGGLGGSARVAGPANLVGTVLANGCEFVGPGQISGTTGNVSASGQASCWLPALPVASFDLSYGSFGGAFAVVGIASSSSTLINQLAVQTLATHDVRNFLRVGLADTGAYEFGASP